MTNLSFKHNVIASYISQLYCALIGIAMVPFLVHYMGAEAYGLVGFFAMLQMWFQVLDVGLTPTMARESARFLGGVADALALRRLLRTLEGIFFAVAFLGAASLIAGASSIAVKWLKAQQLPVVELENAIMLMAVIVALRWVCGLYRGVITGFERIVWLSSFNIAVATVRFVLIIPFFIYVGTSPTQFFSYQLALAIIEAVMLMAQTYRLLPRTGAGETIAWQWQPLRGVARFSLSVAFTAFVWLLITQTDKLVLSTLLSLSDYGYFTLAVLAASGITVICGPVSLALQPRMTKLSEEGNETALILLYRNSTQVVCIIAIPASLMLAFFSEQILWAWTGDAAIALSAAPVLTLYALGNGVLALAAFPYYLQFAKGDLKLHLIGNALFVVVLIPGLVWATLRYGAIGAGYAWLTSNLVYFLFWTPLVHRRFVAGLHLQWLIRDVGGIAVASIVAAGLAYWLVDWSSGRGRLATEIGVLSLVLLVVASSGSSWVRQVISGRRPVVLSEQGEV
jgi:O-antigen/teichoic acid export membrane protein